MDNIGYKYKDLYEKIKFTVIFRILAFSLIILAYVLINFKDINRHSIFIYVSISIASFITFIYSTLLIFFRKKENDRFLVYFGFLQLLVDFIFISAVIVFNGGINGKFIFLYYLLILIAGFIFLRLGVMIFGISSALALGLSADLQYYSNIGYHYYFFYNPDKLLLLTSVNILGVLIFSWLLYHFSGELGMLSDKMVERDEFIRKSQNFNRELFNSFSQGIMVLDDKINVIFLNNEAINMLNLSRYDAYFRNKTGILYKFNIKLSDIIENFPIEIFGEKGKLDNATAGNIANKDKDSLERFELKHKDSILGFALTKLKNAENKTGGFILLFRDITYIKQLELESKINERLTTAGKLAGWLAHEIRNPLSAINTSIYILSSENIDSKENDYKKLIGIIQSEAGRLDNLVNDFLGFVKVKPRNDRFRDNFENINLFLLAEELIRPYAGAYVKIHNGIEKNAVALSEKSRIRQVLANIIQNAVQSVEKKFFDGKSRITGTGIIRISSKKILKTGNKNYVSISVSDNGEGMDDFTKKNAFKPLFTTKENGSGLGLSIVYSIIESMGGETAIISSKGKGTLIKINLPC